MEIATNYSLNSADYNVIVQQRRITYWGKRKVPEEIGIVWFEATLEMPGLTILQNGRHLNGLKFMII